MMITDYDCLFEKTFEHDLQPPRPSTEGSFGLDVCSTETYTLTPGEHKLFKSGWCVKKFPPGVGMLVTPRSGLALKHKVTVLNAPGLIDNDYTQDIGVILINHSDLHYTVTKGDRIAQLVLIAQIAINSDEYLKWAESEKVAATRNGGFGSTGV